jgi:hypothetical protein
MTKTISDPFIVLGDADRGASMPPRELAQALSRRPFVPFRLYITDGTTYEIRHPELLMVFPGSAVVGLPGAAYPFPLLDRFEIVDLLHVVRLEPLDTSKAAGDGAP